MIKVIADTDDKLKTIFYDLYNDKGFGQHTTNKSLQKKLEKFRNNMAVDYYNLILEIEKYPVSERWAKCKQQLSDFANKYLLWKAEGNKPIEFLGDQIDSSDFDLVVYMQVDDYLGMFNTITDKAIPGLEFDEKELKVIKNWLLGDFEQRKNNAGRYGLARMYTPVHNWGMIRALYEWIVLVQSQQTEVKRCKAPKCNKLFIPDRRGKEQLYCSDTCKTRAFRAKHLTATIAIETEMTCKLTLADEKEDTEK